jgi:hypothetical protein
VKKWLAILFLGISIVLSLAACGGTTAAGEPTAVGGESQNSIPSNGEIESVRIQDDYSNALSVAGQLALGTIQLDETDLAVDEAEAAGLLPLWQAYQSLSNSDSAAQAEIDAVLRQLQDTMTPEQVQAIVEMRLTDDSLNELAESGDLTFGFGGRAFQEGDAAAQGGGRGAGFFGGPPDGGPGFGPGGGIPGGGFGNLSEDDIATRQAQFSSGDMGAFQERALTRAVVLLLQNKTGQAPAPGGPFEAVFTLVSEQTGLSPEDIRTQMAEGATLAKIIKDNGGDVEAVRASLIDAFSQMPNAADLDVEQMAADWLGE